MFSDADSFFAADVAGKHVHLINNHGMGDVIMSLPLIMSLIKGRPSFLSVTVKSELEERIVRLFVKADNLNFVRLSGVRNGRSKIFSFFLYVIQLRRLSIDVIYSAYGVDAVLSSVVSYLSGAEGRFGFGGSLFFLNTYNADPNFCEHKIQKNLLLTSRRDFEPDLDVYNNIFKDVNVGLSPFVKGVLDDSAGCYRVIVAPGSGELEKHKRWPVGKYRSLILDMIKLNRIKVFIVGSNLEKELSLEVWPYDDDNVINVVGNLSIEETAQLVRSSNVAICNCNGISHLSAVVGCSVIGLYGPTNYMLTGVYSKSAKIISSNLACSPCYSKNNIMGCGDPVCMSSISVENVFNTLLASYTDAMQCDNKSSH